MSPDPKSLLVRDGRALTQGEVARGTGLSVSFVCKVLNRRKRPSLASASKLAAYLGISVEQLSRYLSGGRDGA